MIDHKVGSSPPKPASPPKTSSSGGEDEKFNGWPFIWTLFAFKVVTISATYYFATRSTADMSILVATHWIWLGIPLAALSGPLLFRWRLHRVRRKRAKLHAAEWMIEGSDDA